MTISLVFSVLFIYVSVIFSVFFNLEVILYTAKITDWGPWLFAIFEVYRVERALPSALQTSLNTPEWNIRYPSRNNLLTPNYPDAYDVTDWPTLRSNQWETFPLSDFSSLFHLSLCDWILPRRCSIWLAIMGCPFFVRRFKRPNASLRCFIFSRTSSLCFCIINSLSWVWKKKNDQR